MQILTSQAARQHGVVHRRTVLAAGFGPGQLQRMVARGLLTRVAFQTYVVAGSPSTWHQALMIAVTTAGKHALASHQTAAYLHGLVDRRPRSIEVVVPRWERAEVEFTVHESLDLRKQDACVIAGIPTSKAVRTVVDLGASAPWMVETALDTGLRRRLFTLEEVTAFVGRVARRGRRGVGVIRPHLEQRLLWKGITESELEDRFRRLWSGRLLQPTPQHVIRDSSGIFVCRADFAFVDHRLRIELDSEAFHMDSATFHRDRAVQNQTELLGWRTLRYTWWDLTSRREAVIAEIEAALH